jgi:pimeloyl-ACP methyl ester carboxylesterase
MKHAPLLIPAAIFALLACSQRAPDSAGGGNATTAIAAAPAEPVLPISKGQDRALKVAVGPPEATLAVWVLEPKAGTPIRGTILFLHGFMANHLQLQGAGEAVRKAGYRAVLVDLRGFGQSTGGHITFGVQDAHDMTQLVDHLQAEDLCGPTLGVYGTSYGAASAILYAAADPRVTTVVAVAPFATIRDDVPSFSRNVLRGAGAWFSDDNLNSIANIVSQVAKLDLDAARPIDAIAKSAARILLIHGDADTIIPHAASELLHAAAPGNSELLTVADRGHIDLCFDFKGELHGPTRNWFDQYLPPKAKP